MTPVPEIPLYLPGGKLMLNAGNMVSSPSDCCCGGSDNPCEHCSGRTPVRMRVTFSGINICTGCVSSGGISRKWTTLPNPPGGPYLLPQVNPCQWEYSEPATGAMTKYTDAVCGAGGVAYAVQSLTVTAWVYDAMTLIVHARYDLSPSVYETPFYKLSYGVSVCDGPWVVNNDNTTCTNWGTWGGKDGTATVVALWS